MEVVVRRREPTPAETLIGVFLYEEDRDQNSLPIASIHMAGYAPPRVTIDFEDSYEEYSSYQLREIAKFLNKAADELERNV